MSLRLPELKGHCHCFWCGGGVGDVMTVTGMDGNVVVGVGLNRVSSHSHVGCFAFAVMPWQGICMDWKGWLKK